MINSTCSKIPFVPSKNNKPDNRSTVGEPPKAMTTAVGFVCGDGVVLAADTQICMGDQKIPKSKYHSFYGMRAEPIFIFASENIWFTDITTRRIVQAIESLDLGMTLESAIQDEVKRIHEDFPQEAEQQELLLAIRLSGRGGPVTLFHIYGKHLYPVSDNRPIGNGRIIVQGMMTEFYDRGLTIEQTALVACFVMAEAKKYGVATGGDTEVLLCRNNQPNEIFPDRLKHLFQTIEEIDKAYFDLKRIARHALLSYCDSGSSQSQFKQETEPMLNWVMEERSRLYSALIDRQASEAERPDDSEESQES